MRKPALCGLCTLFALLLMAGVWPAAANAPVSGAYHQDIPHRGVPYQLVYGEQNLGSVDTYNYLGRVLISLGDLSAALHFQFDLDDDQKNLILTNGNKAQLVTFKLKEQKYQAGDDSGRWYEGELFVDDEEIFLDTGLLNRTLDLQATVEQSSARVFIRNLLHLVTPTHQTPETTTAATIAKSAHASIVSPDSTSISTAVPVGEVGATDLPSLTANSMLPPTAQPAVTPPTPQPEAKIKVAEKEPTEEIQKHKASPKTKIPEPEEDEKDSDEEEGGREQLIVQPVIEHGAEENFFLEAYRDKGKLYVSFEDLMQFLQFYITVSKDKNTAKGTFISAQNTFLMNRKEGFVKAGKNTFTLRKEDSFVEEDLLFVHTKALEKWLPINLELKEAWMQLVIHPEEELPFQTRIKRQKQWLQAKYARQNKNHDYPTITPEYQMAALPFVDIDIDQLYDPNGTNSSFSTAYTVQSAGDLGYHTMNSFVNGSRVEGIQSARFTAERRDSDKALLGALNATEYFFGDIDSASLPLVAQTSTGRGVRVSNRPFDYLPESDTKTFVGDANPNWEVELYRNGVLLEIQTVSSSGRYEFVDIPVLFGRNNFTLIFYGPQGQVEERTEVVQVGDTILKKGEVQYTASADQKGTTLSGLGQDNTQNGSGLRVVSSVDYGVSENLSAGTFFGYLPLADGTTHTYAGVSANTLFYDFLLNTSLAMDAENNGSAWRISALGTVGDVNMRLAQEFNDGLVSEVYQTANNLRTSSSLFDANALLYLPLLEDLNVNFSSQYNTYERTDEDYGAQLRIAKPFFGLSTTNRFAYQYASGTERIDYDSGLQGRIASAFWRLVTQANIKPESEWKNADLSLHYRLTDDIFARSQLRHEFTTPSTFFVQSLSWDIVDYRVSVFGQSNDQGEYVLGMNFGTSFGFLPNGDLYSQGNNMSGGGGVLGNIFLDENYNGLFDDNEEAIEEASLKIDGRRNYNPHPNNVSVPLQGYTTSEVAVDESTIENPLWRSATEGFQVANIPGKFVEVNFPVVSTSEIDGQVMLRNAPVAPAENAETENKKKKKEKSTEPEPVGNMVVQLVDNKGKIIEEAMSESDGFFLIQRVLPGKYQLVVEPKMLKEAGLMQVEIPQVTISKESEFYSDQMIELVAAPEWVKTFETKQQQDAPKKVKKKQ